MTGFVEQVNGLLDFVFGFSDRENGHRSEAQSSTGRAHISESAS